MSLERIYFIHCTETGLVKIGRSMNVKSRLAHIQCDSPTKLELLGSIAVRYASKVERTLHSHFKAQRHHGEWFAINESFEELKVLVKLITSHTRET